MCQSYCNLLDCVSKLLQSAGVCVSKLLKSAGVCVSKLLQSAGVCVKATAHTSGTVQLCIVNTYRVWSVTSRLTKQSDQFKCILINH